MKNRKTNKRVGIKLTMYRLGGSQACEGGASSAHPVVILLLHLTQLALEVQLHLKVQVAVVASVLSHRERARDLFALFNLKVNISVGIQTSLQYKQKISFPLPKQRPICFGRGKLIF